MKYFVILFIILTYCITHARADEANCLALNIYHEARNQPLAGKLAVAQVTLNRVKDDRFPNSICGVVMQGFYFNHNPIINKCQFSWWCDGKSDKPKDIKAWEQAQILAYQLLNNMFVQIDLVKGATHYHAIYVKPYWINKKKKVTVIADHVFYKWEK